MYKIDIEELQKQDVLLAIVLWDVYQDHITDDTVETALALNNDVWDQYQTIRAVGGANTDAKLYHELRNVVFPIAVKEFSNVFIEGER